MLVLTRKLGESVVIGNDIRVTVLIVFENRIKLQLKDSGNKVITCHLGSTTQIRHNIIIKIVDINQQQVKLGIEAPEQITINREEIQKKGEYDAL